FDRVSADREHDRNARRCGFGGKWRRRALDCNDHSHPAANQVTGQCWQSVEATLGPAIFDRDVAALDIASFVETSPDGVKSAGFTVRAAEQPDHRHRRLLSARRERPCDRAAEQRDELAPLYPNHVIPRACAVWVRLKRTLAALAHFARCLGRAARSRRPGGGAMTASPVYQAGPIKRARATKA